MENGIVQAIAQPYLRHDLHPFKFGFPKCGNHCNINQPCITPVGKGGTEPVCSGLESSSNGVVIEVGQLSIGQHIDAEAEGFKFGCGQILVLFSGDVVDLIAH